MPKILLVDDDPAALESTRKILELSGHEVTTAIDGQAALEKARPAPGRVGAAFDIVVSDVRMPRLGGLEFLRALTLCGETTPVILMTAFGRVEDAVWAMKLGAVDFLTKPFKRQQLLTSVEMALKRVRPQAASGEPILIGSSRPIQELREMIAQVAPTAASVLIQGESGTGKELVARLLHRQSQRGKRPMVALNCTAVPEQLMESELFGFEKGAFSGAVNPKIGLFEAADQGTLLLDEIGDMPIQLQPKILRTLQEGEVRRLGSTQSRKIDVRMIAATHRDLREQAKTGAFRQDLLYRLEVITLTVPALRDRPEDLPELAAHFLSYATRRHGKSVQAISQEAMAILIAHAWPGNVRELSNVIERAVVFARQPEITPAELPPHLVSAARSGPVSRADSGTIEVPLGTSLKDVEELLIRKTLEATDGDKNMTAKLLGINSRTIYRKLAGQPSEPEPGDVT
jgi:two-component system, NtrC family, response regulator HydG